MATLALNKASLHRERNALRTYRRFLPSLDLKRRQLTAELAKARAELAARQAEAAQAPARAARGLPMLADEEIDLAGLVRIEEVRLGEINQLGVRLPVLKDVRFVTHDYGLLVKPHWVDEVVAEVQRAARLRLMLQVAQERVRRLELAVRKTTQRVNLFEKVLIPTALKSIQRIEIYLADAERAGVVRSKIAKGKHAEARAGLLGEPAP